MSDTERSRRSTVRRLSERGRYDPAEIRAILDEGLVGHVGFVENGQPFVIPMSYGRDGDSLYLHGSVAGRLLRALGAGAPLCITVTLLDGLVIARSVFHHSMNYRSVVILGRAEIVSEREEKMLALEKLTEHLVPGRWKDARAPNETELAKTLVLRVSLAEASAKVRTGPPQDGEEDYGLLVWAGVLPYGPAPGPLEPDPRLDEGLEPPDYLTGYRRPLN
jgi:nitroimidazol reductase NimA-like FMN-containing flavoprotein (pyridoxamine 5'-phosphate oxidase superfamily)